MYFYKKSKVAVIVAARMKSTRLPKKALLPIGGLASIERCLLQCMALSDIDRTILATSDLDEDQVLSKHLLGGQVDFWVGDADDVISRYIGACEKYNLDAVVRITGDCPLILPELLDYMLHRHMEAEADFSSALFAPVGSVGEIINTSALKKVKSHFGKAELSEYMSWYFLNNPEYFKNNVVEMPVEWRRHYRLTLDYQEDLDMFRELYRQLGNETRAYGAQEVFNVLDSSPSITSINEHLSLKYESDRDLIDLLNIKTKIK